MQRRILIFICSALLGLMITFNLPVRSRSVGFAQSQVPPALELALEGQQLYQVGKLSEAADIWQQAADAYDAEGDHTGTMKSLINQSQALQDLGLYPRACKSLLRAFEVENADCSEEQIDGVIRKFGRNSESKLTVDQGIGLRSLSDVLRRKGMLTKSQKLLQFSWLGTQDSPESGATLLSLGNVERALGNQTRDRWNYDQITEIIERQSPEIALEPYQSAFKAYQQAAIQSVPSITQLQGQVNHLSLLLEIEKWWGQQTDRRIASWQRLEQSESSEEATNFLAALNATLDKSRELLLVQIESSLTQISPSHAGIYAQVNLAQSLTSLKQTDKVELLLNNSLKQAMSLQDQRAETYVLGYLGKFQAQQGQLQSAIALTNQALILAQEQNINGDAREISYLWQSQLGQLLEKQGKRQDAIAAYTAAFNILQSLRTDLNANNEVVQFDFRQEVQPVYLKLADLLLQLDSNELKPLTSIKFTGTQQQSEIQSDNNLELARKVIESLQLAELDNFFQDPCSQVSDLAISIDDLDSQAAIIYPIVLADRLEVIFSLPGKPLKRFKVAIAESEVNQTLDRLYDTLYNRSVDNSAINIFSTTPLDPQEFKENTQKLLPILRQIYSWLIEPLETELDSNQIKTLVFVPNGRLQSLPMSALYDGQQYLLEKYSVALAPSLQLIDSRPIKREKLKVLAAGVSEQVEIQGEIFPPLGNVPQELDQIKTAFPASQKLLNKEFTTASIKSQLQSNFPVIHLATHGLFSSDPKKTFIVTGDRNIINVDQLSRLLGSENAFQPELIVLSACETATGDERAILGLAGVAIRSGTRSTLATLWSVGDASTAKLMGQFYRELENPEISKVHALQNAQLSLLKSLRSNPTLPELKQLPPHPYYWASYVLVGNWR